MQDEKKTLWQKQTGTWR